MSCKLSLVHSALTNGSSFFLEKKNVARAYDLWLDTKVPNVRVGQNMKNHNEHGHAMALQIQFNTSGTMVGIKLMCKKNVLNASTMISNVLLAIEVLEQGKQGK